MNHNIMYFEKKLTAYVAGEEALTAYKVLSDRLKSNFGIETCVMDGTDAPASAPSGGLSVVLIADSEYAERDGFTVRVSSGAVTLKSLGRRGLIYAAGLLLRKLEKTPDGARLVCDISGEYHPHKKVRGHQLGYRTLPNTYDAWTLEQYREYIIDIMLFGANTVEDTVYEDTPENRNCLMKYTQEELLDGLSDICDELDIDLSLWYPNADNETADEGAAAREKLFSSVKRIDYYFPPGGDPGRLEAAEFISRTLRYSKILKKYHPYAKVYPSAQTPGEPFGEWAETFVNELKKCPDGIDGVVVGPNWAYPLEMMRVLLPRRYPIRYYPDITHNLRCEHPAPNRHFALSNALSRESCNPRMSFYRDLHAGIDQYCEGSVTYSEGAHDDINKMFWSYMDQTGSRDVADFAEDYARLFFPGRDTAAFAGFICDTEKAWYGDPVGNEYIDRAFEFISGQTEDGTDFDGNWRLALAYFKAACDKYVKLRRIDDLAVIDSALTYISGGDSASASKVLTQAAPAELKALRDRLSSAAETLFRLIGIQLDIEHYHADGIERGAVLDTIDFPVTDRQLLMRAMANAAPSLIPSDDGQFLIPALDYEYYLSFAGANAGEVLKEQLPYYYMDIQGDRERYIDRPIPMRMSVVYDHYSFVTELAGIDNGHDHLLRVNYLTKYNDDVDSLRITANDYTVYLGQQYGGARDEAFDRVYSVAGFETRVYRIPGSVVHGGKLRLCISEPLQGIRICELALVPAPRDNQTK